MIAEKDWIDAISGHGSFGRENYRKDQYNPEEWRYLQMCSAYTRKSYRGSPLLVAVPMMYYPEGYNTHEAISDWVKQINELGGDLKFDGIGPFRNPPDNFIKILNKMVWQAENTRKRAPLSKFFKEGQLWAHFILDSHLPRQNYYTYVLLRFLSSPHYQRIVDMYYAMLKDGLSQMDAIQLAQYSHSHTYNPYYGLLDGNYAWVPRDLDTLKEWFIAVDGHTTTLNGFFQYRRLASIDVQKLKKLILEQKYKKAYELLKG